MLDLQISSRAARIYSTIQIGVVVVAVEAALPPLQLQKLKLILLVEQILEAEQMILYLMGQAKLQL